MCGLDFKKTRAHLERPSARTRERERGRETVRPGVRSTNGGYGNDDHDHTTLLMGIQMAFLACYCYCRLQDFSRVCPLIGDSEASLCFFVMKGDFATREEFSAFSLREEQRIVRSNQKQRGFLDSALLEKALLFLRTCEKQPADSRLATPHLFMNPLQVSAGFTKKGASIMPAC